MGLFDLFTLGIAVVGYQIGRSRGLVWQLSGIGTLVVGGLSATILSRPLGPVFADGILGRFVAWVVLYAAVAISLYVLTIKLKDKIKEYEFDELDKRFGGMVGSFKGLFAFAVATLVAVAVSTGVGNAVKASASGRGLSYLVHELEALLPEKIHAAFGPYLDRVHPAGSPEPVEPAPVEPAPPPSTPRLEPIPRAPVERTVPPRPKPGPPPAPPLDPLPDVDFAPGYPPTPSHDPAPDPFDTSQDGPDPLAPD